MEVTIASVSKTRVTPYVPRPRVAALHTAVRHRRTTVYLLRARIPPRNAVLDVYDTAVPTYRPTVARRSVPAERAVRYVERPHLRRRSSTVRTCVVEEHSVAANSRARTTLYETAAIIDSRVVPNRTVRHHRTVSANVYPSAHVCWRRTIGIPVADRDAIDDATRHSRNHVVNVVRRHPHRPDVTAQHRLVHRPVTLATLRLRARETTIDAHAVLQCKGGCPRRARLVRPGRHPEFVPAGRSRQGRRQARIGVSPTGAVIGPSGIRLHVTDLSGQRRRGQHDRQDHQGRNPTPTANQRSVHLQHSCISSIAEHARQVPIHGLRKQIRPYFPRGHPRPRQHARAASSYPQASVSAKAL